MPHLLLPVLPCALALPSLLSGIGLKNIHCLRTVFNVAHRLADTLGNSWALVVEVLYTLDRALPAVGSGSGGKVHPRESCDVLAPSTALEAGLAYQAAGHKLWMACSAGHACGAPALERCIFTLSFCVLGCGSRTRQSHHRLAGRTAPELALTA